MRNDQRLEELEKERRLLIAECMIDLIRRDDGQVGENLSELLVGLAVVVSTFGPRRLGLEKIAGIAGLPKSTVRRALNRLCDQGTAEKFPDKTYRITPEFALAPARLARMAKLEKAIRSAGRRLKAIDRARKQAFG